MTTFTIKTGCERELLETVFQYLEKRKRGMTNLFFSGESDSHQTEFERASNHMEIGVLASNKKNSLVLLFFTRIIVDNRKDLLMSHLYGDYEDEPCFKEGEKAKLGKIVKRLAEFENDGYITHFALDSLDEKISCTLYDGFKHGDLTIEKHLDEVDLWTLPRVKKAIIGMF